MTTQNKETYTILEGPCKFDLMLSVMEGKEVDFTIQYKNLEPFKMSGKIMKLGPESGGYQQWLITFSSGKAKYKGYFNSKQRNGYFHCN